MNGGVIVLGGHVQGYGILRIFGENNIPSIVIDTTRQNIARHSKYCTHFIEVDYDNLINKLVEIGQEGRIDNWLLFPTDDYYVRLLSQNKNLLDQYYLVTVDEWDIIKLFFNKRNSYPLAESAGVPIPKTFYPNNPIEVKQVSSEIEYPCIIKPAVMLDFYRHFKQKVFVCKNEHELNTNFLKATEIIKTNEILVQEIIPGDSEKQYSVGVFYDRKKSYNYIVARRKRQHPIDFGNATTFAETVDIPILIDYSHKILKKAEYFGICEVEFKYDERDEKYKFLEVNPRTWKWHTITQSAQIPLLMSIYKYFKDSKPIIKKDYQIARWRDLFTDIPVILQLLFMNRYEYSNTEGKLHEAVLNLKDPLPFIYQLLYIPLNIIRR